MHVTKLDKNEEQIHAKSKKSFCCETSHPISSEDDKDKFKCLYILVEAAIAVQQLEKKQKQVFV
jgi:hypothetical protein